MLQVRLGGLNEVPFVLGEGGERLVLVEGVEREVVVATASELNTKFAQEANKFFMAFGGLNVFYGGLEGLIGSPSPKVLDF